MPTRKKNKGKDGRSRGSNGGAKAIEEQNGN